MRKIDALLEEYGESHQNERNKRIHWVCVPVIFWCVLALIHEIPSIGAIAWMPFGWLGILLTLSLVYYAVLSPTLALGFVVVSALSMGLILAVEAVAPVWQVALAAFVLAWIGQFWGHRIEGKKPSFFKDVQFLMIGPAWLLSFIYRRLGIPI
ncbi:MAG: DUF962 domain-containing protein [Alphaproteobacteria bacterium]|nr:DUF962 domain-containing protein [Alphaproteobacteria bacterium]